ncbi:DUF4302 domain-containing protein [Polaribacter atrinae]|nr:DUF4302 domain-containing protein [Polaribacter atrinae]
MKKYIKKSFAFLLLIVMATSCIDNTEEMVFEESSSERIQNAISEYKELLISSENGWVVEYYVGVDQSYGGYNFVMKFNEDLTANVVMELGFDDPQSNMYNVIASGGPVLTLNTYNWLTHFFANPSSTNADGFEGDYEFFLLSSTEDTITMKGKKFGNIMKMIKLTETPEEYLTKVTGINDYLSAASGFINIDGTVSPISLSGRHVVLPSEDLDVAFIYTDNGIKLYETTIINGNEVSDFTLDTEADQLVSLDGSTIIELATFPVDMAQDWFIEDVTDANNVSTSFYNSFVDVYNVNYATWGEILSTKILIGNTTIGGLTEQAILFRSGNYSAQYIISFSPVYGGSNQIAMSKVEPGLNWTFYTQLEPLLDLIIGGSPYTTELNSEDNPTEVKYVSNADADFWFVIKL